MRPPSRDHRLKILLDYDKRAIRLTAERLAHILEHPEMAGMEQAIERTLSQPLRVVRSISDPAVSLYYRFYNDGRRDPMAPQTVSIWFDPEGDYLEVLFDRRAGYFRETASDQVMEKVDEDGNVLGFSILRVSALKAAPLEVAL